MERLSDEGQRAREVHALAATLRPRSIAVVGASPRSFAGQIVQQNCAAHGYRGLLAPVNGKYAEVAGVPTVPSLSHLGTAPDVVVALVGTARVQAIAEEAAAIGASAVIVPGGGFTDSGDAATDLAASLATLANVTGIAVVGPNCMGVTDLVTGAMPYIGTVPRQMRRGSVAAIAQSGAVIEALVNCGGRVPFSTLVSSGSEAVTTTADYLRFFAGDPETDSVLLFIEGFVDAPDVLQAAREVTSAGKTVAACFVGRSAKAREGIVAHSGKLAPSWRVTAAALEQAGVVVGDDLDELIAVGEVLGTGRRVRGARTHIVTNSGGEANLLSDLAEDAGLLLPDLTDDAATRLTAKWPAFHAANPLDPWGVSDYREVYPLAIEALANESGDIVIVSQDQQTTAGDYERQLGLDLARYLDDATRSSTALPVMLSPTSQDPDPRLTTFCHEHDIALLRGARSSLRALAALARQAPPASEVTRRPERIAAITDAAEITEDVALQILAARGVRTPLQIRVSTTDAAVAAASGIDGPVVIKAVAGGLLHKSDLGLVITNVVGPHAVRRAAIDVLARARQAGLDVELLVVEQVSGALDVVIGYKRDPQFGPTTLVGLGGVWTELLDSVSVHVGPMDLDAAHRLLDRSHVGRMMRDARGGALDVTAVAHALVAVSDLGLAHPEIAAIDVNPVIVGRSHAIAVDAVIERDGPDSDAARTSVERTVRIDVSLTEGAPS
ncbi:MAG TPA: acetate--CoA ligase family protein [Actinomycetes bacterium]|nr:acetate--CoA ligase family protein [Actinomycetes bacterium]